MADPSLIITFGSETFTQMPRTDVAADHPSAPADRAAPTVPGYEIEGELGRGGMGVVYRARHLGLNRQVALKMILVGCHSDADLMNRFWAEAQMVAKLQHPGIVQVYDSGTHDGLPYCALELLTGGSLDDRLQGGHPPPREAAQLVCTLARTMHAAHTAGVVHRDLKPSNILFTADGQPKVNDFGVAKQLAPVDAPGAKYSGSRTQSGDVIGTPDYMAPEQAAGSSKNVGPAADIYALGVILYEMLTGSVPFVGLGPMDVLMQVLSLDPVPPRRRVPSVPADLDVICMKCLEKEPGRRYVSAQALADDLERYLDDRPILARPVSAIEKLQRWRRRNPLVASLIGGIVGLFLAAFAVVSWSYWRAEESRQEAERNREAERWEHYRANIVAAGSALQMHNVGEARRLLENAPEEARNWEWRHFQQQLDGAQSVIGGTDSDVDSMPNFTPDGRLLGLYTAKHSLEVWDLAERRQVRLFPNAPELASFRLNPDGLTLAYALPDGTIIVRDLVSDQIRATLRGHSQSIYTMDFSSDGRRLASGSNDKTVRIWNTATGELMHDLRGHKASVIWLAFSKDNSRLATSARGDRTCIWDLATGQLITTVPDFAKLGFNPAGTALFVYDNYPDVTARLWDLTGPKRIQVLEGHTNQLLWHSFNRDGTRIATCSFDQTARLWDGNTGKPIAALEGHNDKINQVAFSPDGKRLITAAHDDTLRLWDAASGKALGVLHGHAAPVLNATYSHGGDHIYSVSRDGVIRIWDPRSVEDQGIFRGHTSFVYDVAFAPDGKRVASASWDGTVRLWDVATRQCVMALHHPGGKYASSVAIHPNGRHLASVCRDGKVRLWDTATGQELRHWRVPADNWRDTRVTFAPKGDLLASGSSQGAVYVWDVAQAIATPTSKDGEIGLSGAEPIILRGHRGVVFDVAFSPNGQWLAAAGEDQTIHIWNATTKETVQVLEGHKDWVQTLGFSRDGKLLASGSQDETIRLWDTTNWTAIGEPLRLGTNIFHVAFTADGTRLAVACRDKTIRLWDVERQQQVAELRGHSDYVHALSFSPDGSRLISASGDHTLRMWDTLPATERARPSGPASGNP